MLMNADDFTSSLPKPFVFLDSGLIFLQFVIGVLCFDVLSQVPIAAGYGFFGHENVGESSLNEERTTGDLGNWAREGCSLPSQTERKQP